MKLDLTEEQQMLCDSVARLLQTESSMARVRAVEATGFDPVLWNQMREMGVLSMRVAESSGGGGMGLLDAVLVAEHAGCHLASIPFAEALSAKGLLAHLEGQVAARYLADALDGEVVVLHPRELRDDEPLVLPTTASVVIALRGNEVLAIRNLDQCDEEEKLLCSNLGNEPIALFAPGCVGVRHLVARGPSARAAFLAALDEWKLLKAAMLVGLSAQALQMAADYSRERTQFGRPIGAFQGIAHPLADALTEIDGARLLIWHAIWAIAHGKEDAGALISMAWWWSAKASSNAVARALHTFGGYGVSLEYDIQLYYRRGKAWSLLAGDPQQELHQVADRLWPRGGTSGFDTRLPEVGEVSMQFGYGCDAEHFAEEVRAFFSEHLTDAYKAHAHHSVAGYHPQFHQQLAQAGLLFPHWPEEYGGRGKTPFDMAALGEVFEEFNWQRITGPITNQVAQIVMRFGNDELKQEVLPRFASADALACMGFTEPSCGSDVFAAKTRAARADDGSGDWIIDGQKIFTTAANLADYIFLLVRTGVEQPKHAGLSLFLVPMNSPGIEVQAVHTMQDERTNITYLLQVRVADRYRIGEVNGGAAVMAATLELEHGGDQYRISFSNMYQHALTWARNTYRGGVPLIDDADVRRRLASVAVHVTIAKDLCYRSIWATENAIPGRAAYGPMSKLFSTERYLADAADLMDLAAPYSLFADRHGLGHVEIGYRQAMGMTIYGGTSEVHRSLIAEQGLKMPRSRT
ncbi:acyl-CoA dehydrogenase [Herminiimonas arsenitoxidans]|uniref:acyl-CoA dehydrogenase n=1 Tax=Herminiimonas arsenitoxidans TaxID=1809410 RepID=UPI0009714C7D|nr:acyl-CoA dehydrogenase [Herminiimonas arsenitoxidans]